VQFRPLCCPLFSPNGGVALVRALCSPTKSHPRIISNTCLATEVKSGAEPKTGRSRFFPQCGFSFFPGGYLLASSRAVKPNIFRAWRGWSYLFRVCLVRLAPTSFWPPSVPEPVNGFFFTFNGKNLLWYLDESDSPLAPFTCLSPRHLNYSPFSWGAILITPCGSRNPTARSLVYALFFHPGTSLSLFWGSFPLFHPFFFFSPRPCEWRVCLFSFGCLSDVPRARRKLFPRHFPDPRYRPLGSNARR